MQTSEYLKGMWVENIDTGEVFKIDWIGLSNDGFNIVYQFYLLTPDKKRNITHTVFSYDRMDKQYKVSEIARLLYGQ